MNGSPQCKIKTLAFSLLRVQAYPLRALLLATITPCCSSRKHVLGSIPRRQSPGKVLYITASCSGGTPHFAILRHMGHCMYCAEPVAGPLNMPLCSFTNTTNTTCEKNTWGTQFADWSTNEAIYGKQQQLCTAKDEAKPHVSAPLLYC